MEKVTVCLLKHFCCESLFLGAVLPPKSVQKTVQVLRSISTARSCMIFKICLKMMIFIFMLMLKSRCFKVLKFLLDHQGLENCILKC